MENWKDFDGDIDFVSTVRPDVATADLNAHHGKRGHHHRSHHHHHHARAEEKNMGNSNEKISHPFENDVDLGCTEPPLGHHHKKKHKKNKKAKMAATALDAAPVANAKQFKCASPGELTARYPGMNDQVSSALQIPMESPEAGQTPGAFSVTQAYLEQGVSNTYFDSLEGSIHSNNVIDNGSESFVHFEGGSFVQREINSQDFADDYNPLEANQVPITEERGDLQPQGVSGDSSGVFDQEHSMPEEFAGDAYSINASMVKAEPLKPWYHRPLVWASIVLGICLLAGIITGIVLGTKPTSSPKEMTDEQIACDFIKEPEINTCRQTLDFRGQPQGSTIPPQISTLTQLTILVLNQGDLSGSIPSSIAMLTMLIELSLSDNQLIGTIPPAIGDLTRLTSLSFNDNALTGTIPTSIEKLTQLSTLSFSNNDMNGTVPESLCGNNATIYFNPEDDLACPYECCKEMERPSSSPSSTSAPTEAPITEAPTEAGTTFAPLTEAPVTQAPTVADTTLAPSTEAPTTLAPVTTPITEGPTSLAPSTVSPSQAQSQTIVESYEIACDFFGMGGDLLKECQRAEELSQNNYDGTIPSEIGVLTQLTYLDLRRWYTYYLSGTIPSSLGDLTNLEHLDVSDNYLTGTFPSFMSNLTLLSYLNMRDNYFTGSIPTTIGSLTFLDYWDLHNNNLTGTIPDSMTSMSALTYLDLEWNPQLDGTLPLGIGSLTNLTYFSIAYNINIGGTISSEFGYLDQLVYLNFFNCSLTGSLPESIGNLALLTALDVSYNQLTGNLPESIGNLALLTYLGLSYNQLTGILPESVGNLTLLEDLKFSHNQFTGTIPSFLANLTSLSEESFDFSNNTFTGTFPSSICTLAASTGFYPIVDCDKIVCQPLCCYGQNALFCESYQESRGHYHSRACHSE